MWTWNDIETDWLLPGSPAPADPRFTNRVVLSHSHAEVVEAFDVVEGHFGRGWIEERRQERRFIGILEVVMTGSLLQALRNVRQGQKLVAKLRACDVAAQSEAAALYLIRHSQQGLEIEYEPEVTIGSRTAVPDFRLRSSQSEQWTYLEVASPQSSKDQQHLRKILDRLATTRLVTDDPVALEIELHRIPTEVEVDGLEQRLQSPSRPNEDIEEALPSGLGRMSMTLGNADEPGARTSSAPAIFATSIVMVDGIVRGRSTVTISYSDPRSERFLRHKARQLPDDAPGLVMLDVGRASGGSREWQSAMSSRLGRNLHTRVSGVCLFERFTTVTDGLEWGLAASYTPNDNARLNAPAWLCESLRSWPSMQHVLMGKTRPKASE